MSRGCEAKLLLCRRHSTATAFVTPSVVDVAARRAVAVAQGIWSRSGSLQDFVEQGGSTGGDTVRALLGCIAEADDQLQCFEHVLGQNMEQQQVVCGAAVRRRRPLEGVPVAMKDIIAVDGMPTSCGSILEERGVVDISRLVGAEGPFVRRLRDDLGCVVIGKTKTVEFASGGLGINPVRGTPWNPADLDQHRIPGGSSSGSAAAVAAGLAGFAIGSDTGGSVRIPAALCGVVGLKTSVSRAAWPTAGVLPYSATFDTLGLLARSVADACFIFSAIEQQGAIAPANLSTGSATLSQHRYVTSVRWHVLQ